MKKTFFTIALLSAFIVGWGQPSITNLSYQSTVDLFGLYEISFKLPHYNNPYDPDTISVYGVFNGPNYRCDTVLGFYIRPYVFSQDPVGGFEVAEPLIGDNNIHWSIRFTPDTIGRWEFFIHAQDIHGETFSPARPNTYSFECELVENAKGFISKANERFLKREVVEDREQKQHSFFPVGPNVAWYSQKVGTGYNQIYGIYEYERRIDSLAGNCNYMRIWLNTYQYLNLYGPEYTQNQAMYFDTTLNQKDAAELDHIVAYAAQNNIALMMCIFTFGDFIPKSYNVSYPPGTWEYNPFNTVLHLNSPNDFFTDTQAKKITKNLIRYIIARWGYATNVMCWELWNEVDQIQKKLETPNADIIDWHNEMEDYIRSTDPFGHLVSTSTSGYNNIPELYQGMFNLMDFIQRHRYCNIQYAESKQQTPYTNYLVRNQMYTVFPSTPFFMGEFGFSPTSVSTLQPKDPFGIDLHNSLWASLFSASMGPTSKWSWFHVDSCGLYNRFKPLLEFCNQLPMLSGSFNHYTTAVLNNHFLDCENGILTYYMKNASEDTIYGWCQDTAFCYQSLRRLTDSVYLHVDKSGIIVNDSITNDTVFLRSSNWMFMDSIVLDPSGYLYTLDITKRPPPCSNSNVIKIPISSKPTQSLYKVRWFNSETGLAYNFLDENVSVQRDSMGNKYILISFPSSIRDLVNQAINNTFGDAVFGIYFRKGVYEPGTYRDN